MIMPSEKYDNLVGNLAKALTIAVIAAGIALVIAVFIYTV
jgi:hypothetical protein